MARVYSYACFTLCLAMSCIMLSGCGIKPSSLDAPYPDKVDDLQRQYPAKKDPASTQ